MLLHICGFDVRGDGQPKGLKITRNYACDYDQVLPESLGQRIATQALLSCSI